MKNRMYSRVSAVTLAGLLAVAPAALAQSASAATVDAVPTDAIVAVDANGNEVELPVLADGTIDRSQLARTASDGIEAVDEEGNVVDPVVVDDGDVDLSEYARDEVTPAGDGTVIENPDGEDIMPINAPLDLGTDGVEPISADLSSGGSSTIWKVLTGLFGLTTLGSLGWGLTLRRKFARVEHAVLR